MVDDRTAKKMLKYYQSIQPGGNYEDVAEEFDVSKSTVGRAIRKVTKGDGEDGGDGEIMPKGPGGDGGEIEPIDSSQAAEFLDLVKDNETVAKQVGSMTGLNLDAILGQLRNVVNGEASFAEKISVGTNIMSVVQGIEKAEESRRESGDETIKESVEQPAKDVKDGVKEDMKEIMKEAIIEIQEEKEESEDGE